MEDNDEKNSLIPLVASLILAALVVGLLIFYKPNKIADLDHGTEAQGSSETEDTPNPNIELDAEIIATERRGNDYYVQVQTNGTFEGTCKFTITSSDDERGMEQSAKLEPADRVSACESSFPLKGMNPGEHDVTVLVTARDGSTKSVLKTVNIE
jgi:hypothetical protein